MIGMGWWDDIGIKEFGGFGKYASLYISYGDYATQEESREVCGNF